MCKVHKSSQIYVESDKPVLINWTVNTIAEECNDLEEEKEQKLVEEHEKKQKKVYKETYMENVKQRGKQILDEAYDEAKRIMKEANQNADSIFKKAQDDGFKKGFAEGEISSEKKYNKLIKQAECVLDGADKERKKIITGIECEIIELQAETTEKIIKQKIESDDEVFIKIVKSALERFKLDSKLSIKVSPSEYEAVKKREENFNRINNVKNIRIVKDSEMERGDCVISAESGEIDAGVETQISYIKEGLKQIV